MFTFPLVLFFSQCSMMETSRNSKDMAINTMWIICFKGTSSTKVLNPGPTYSYAFVDFPNLFPRIDYIAQGHRPCPRLEWSQSPSLPLTKGQLGCTLHPFPSVPMVFSWCSRWGFLGIKNPKIPTKNMAYIRISHRGTLVGVPPTIPWDYSASLRVFSWNFAELDREKDSLLQIRT